MKENKKGEILVTIGITLAQQYFDLLSWAVFERALSYFIKSGNKSNHTWFYSNNIKANRKVTDFKNIISIN